MLGAAESIPVLPPGIVQEQFGRTVVFRKSASIFSRASWLNGSI